MHVAKKLEGRENYYYTVVTDANLYDIKRDKILSYGDYLRSL